MNNQKWVISIWTQTLLIQFRTKNLCYAIYHILYSSILLLHINNWLICFYFCFLRDKSNPLNLYLHCWAHTNSHNFVNSSLWQPYVRPIHVTKTFSGMERRFWLICIYFIIKRIEWRIKLELVCVEPNYVYGTASFELSDLSQMWKTVSQSAVWVAMCHQHTAPSARSLFNKDRLCFETLPLSVGFPPVFVLSPPLLSFPILCTEDDVRCQNKNEMLEGAKE